MVDQSDVARVGKPERRKVIRQFGPRPRTVNVETIDDFDRDIVTFVVNWAPYGGPPVDEVLPRFGITSDRLDQRVRDIVADGRTRNLSIDDRALLLRALALLNSTRRTTVPAAAVMHGTSTPVGRT